MKSVILGPGVWYKQRQADGSDKYLGGPGETITIEKDEADKLIAKGSAVDAPIDESAPHA